MILHCVVKNALGVLSCKYESIKESERKIYHNERYTYNKRGGDYSNWDHSTSRVALLKHH